MAKTSTRTKTVPGAPKPEAPAVAAVDYSAANVSLEICQAAGLRNGMTPEAVHAAIARVIEQRKG